MKMFVRSSATLLMACVGVGCVRGGAEPNGHGATGAADPEPVADPGVRAWKVGEWYAYALKVTTAVAFGDGASVIDFDLAGLLQITPTAADSAGVTLYMALAEPKMTSRISGAQGEFDKIARDLGSTGCFVTLSAGRLVEMRFPHGLSAMAANSYREIASALQFAGVPRGADRSKAMEYDTTGQYEAEYELDRKQQLWHKRKLRYTAILAAKNAPPNVPGQVVPRIERSDGEIRLSDDGRPVEITFDSAVTLDGAQQPIHSKTSLSLRAGRSEPAKKAGPDWAPLMAAMDRVAADDPYGPAGSIESLDKARINGMTFETAVAGLEQLAKAGRGSIASSINGSSLDADDKAQREKRTEEASRLFIALAAIFREQPETVGKAVRKIKAKSPAADMLAEALSAASSPAAQQALVSLASAKGIDADERNKDLMALSRTPAPDAKSVETFKAVLRGEPFHEIALLGLGTFSRRMRDAGQFAPSNEIGALLVERLAAASNTPDRLLVLRALTNAGYAPALEPVRAYLGNADENVRAAAVRALQSMKTPAADALLAERLEADPSAAVQTSALNAAKVREPTDVLAAAVEKTASGAADPHVRYRAVELLATWTARRPGVRATLEHIAKNDDEARIRERAQEAL